MSVNQDKIERRRFIRHPMCFPLKYQIIKEDVNEGPLEEYSTTTDVSRTGLSFSAKYPAKPDSLILIRMPFQDKIFNVRAKVVYCNKTPEVKLYSIGVCFQEYKDAFKAKLIEQMYLISEYRDIRSMQLGKEISLQEASKEWIRRYSERFSRLYW